MLIYNTVAVVGTADITKHVWRKDVSSKSQWINTYLTFRCWNPSVNIWIEITIISFSFDYQLSLRTLLQYSSIQFRCRIRLRCTSNFAERALFIERWKDKLRRFILRGHHNTRMTPEPFKRKRALIFSSCEILFWEISSFVNQITRRQRRRSLKRFNLELIHGAWLIGEIYLLDVASQNCCNKHKTRKFYWTLRIRNIPAALYSPLKKTCFLIIQSVFMWVKKTWALNYSI